MDTLPRPNVTPERYRELEILSMQLMCMLPHQDLGECLIIRDICTNIMRRWFANERLAEHEPPARKTVALAEDGGRVIHLRPAE